MEMDFIKKSLDENTPKDMKIKIELSNKDYFKIYILWICKGITIIIIRCIILMLGINLF